MLPLLYHTHHNLHPEDIPFWLELAAESSAGIFQSPILELGCGTGRVLVPLAQHGYTVYGLDHDFDMLLFLHQNLPARVASRVHIFQADFAALHLHQRFGLILMPCNTFSTLTSEVRQVTLESVRQLCSQHAQPGNVQTFGAALGC
jgi:SAM-dependent methyltransferase